MSSPVPELLKQLKLHIQTNVPSLKAVHEEFPPANLALQYPCVSLHQSSVEHTNLDPYALDPDAVLVPDLQNKVTTKWVVGQYDLTIQVDVWARNKVERDLVSELVYAALNPLIRPRGLSLQLTDYHNIWARYDVAANVIDDSDASVQRQEWRQRIDILAHCKVISQGTDFAMITIENQLTTPDTIPSS